MTIRMKADKLLIGRETEIPAENEYTLGILHLKDARNCAVCVRCLYHELAKKALQVRMYWSPGEGVVDTVPYAWYDVTLTAGTEVQETALVDVPEQGDLVLKGYNQDANYSVRNIAVYVSLRRYDPSKFYP